MAGIPGMGQPQDIQDPVAANNIGASLVPQMSQAPAPLQIPSQQASPQPAPVNQPAASASVTGDPQVDALLAENDKLHAPDVGGPPKTGDPQVDALLAENHDLHQDGGSLDFGAAADTLKSAAGKVAGVVGAVAPYLSTKKLIEAIAPSTAGQLPGGVSDPNDPGLAMYNQERQKQGLAPITSDDIQEMVDPKKDRSSMSDVLAVPGDMLAGHLLSAGVGSASEALAKSIATADKVTPPTQSIQNAANEVRDASQRIQDATGVKLNLSPAEASPLDLNAEATAKTLASTPQMQEHVQANAEKMADVLEKISEQSGISTDVKVGTGQRVADKIRSAQDVVGKMINDHIDEAIENSNGATVDLPATKNTLYGEDGLVSKVGFDVNPKGQIVVGDKPYNPRNPSSEVLSDMAFNTKMTESEAKDVGREMYDIHERLQNNNNRMDLEDLDLVKSRLNRAAQAANAPNSSSTPAYKNFISQMRKSVAGDLSDSIGTFLGPESQETFNASKQSYGQIKDSLNTLSGVMKNDNVTSQSLAQNIFSKGKDSLERVKALRTVLMDQDPSLWSDLVGQHVQSLIEAAPTGKNKMKDLSYVSAQLKKLGPEVLEQMGGNQFSQRIDDFHKLSTAVQNGAPLLQGTPTASQMGYIKKGLNAISYIVTPKVKFEQWVSSIDQSKDFAAYINKVGPDKVAQGLPAKSKATVLAGLRAYSNLMASGQANLVQDAVRRANQ